jgi:hypothetical protein
VTPWLQIHGSSCRTLTSLDTGHEPLGRISRSIPPLCWSGPGDPRAAGHCRSSARGVFSRRQEQRRADGSTMPSGWRG